MKNIIVPFGGFYESEHSASIDNVVDNLFTDDQGDYLEGFDCDMVDYKSMHVEYSKNYLTEVLKVVIDDVSDISIDFEFLELISPREYNFKTDEIGVNVSDSDYKLLVDHFIRTQTFIDFVNVKAQSRSGFISFYTPDQVLNDVENEILGDYIMSYICSDIDMQEYSDNTVFYEQEVLLTKKGEIFLDTIA